MPDVVKKVTRTKKTPSVSNADTAVIGQKTDLLSVITDVESQFTALKTTYEMLQKEIVELRSNWEKEKIIHNQEMSQRNQQEEIDRKREQETYAYEINLIRKKAEDEFRLKKETWERDLSFQKETLEKERKELEMLRKQVAGFDIEKAKAVKEAEMILEKQLQNEFDIQRKLTNQETQSRESILNLKLETLEKDNARLTEEVTLLKQAINKTTQEVKEIAVKVIESRGNHDYQTGTPADLS